MIKNDRQYRLTKAQARAFEGAMGDLSNQTVPPGVDPNLAEIQKRALESQFEELSSEVLEYEKLKSGKITAFEAQSLDELPTLLVKARIARGMMHKDLAALLKVKEQQVQRWESNDFAGASIETLKAVADALGVVFTQRMFVPNASVTASKFLSSLNAAGLSPDFILNRVVPPQLAASLKSDVAGLKELVNAASTVAKIFGFKMRDLLELKTPQLDFSVVASTRFKLPARANKNTVSGYTVYAHYLAAVIASCMEPEQNKELPTDYHAFYDAVTKPGKPMTFERVIRFLWECGIIVLPLREAGGFHGAVWKISGRFVMVLKQTTPLESRWLYDSLHESGHIKNGDVTDDVSLIEDQEISPEISGDEEEAANEWAEETLFNGRAGELEEVCTTACKGKLQNLKAVLPKVAKDFNVNPGSLANHMAYRLAEQNQNWWGAAHNLQSTSHNPFETARAVLLEHVNLSCLSQFDRELLQRALSEE